MKTPPNTTLQLNTFACARLLQVGLPFRHDPELPIINPDQHPIEEFRDAVVLMDRALWEGEWLKLATSDFDYAVRMSPSGAQVSKKAGLTAPILCGSEGHFDFDTDAAEKICVYELPAAHAEKRAPHELLGAILEVATRCKMGRAVACIVVLPKKAELFVPEVPPEMMTDTLKSLPFGVMSHEHGATLKKHITRLITSRIQQSAEGVPEEVKGWRECREDFTGRVFYENVITGQKRWAPPQIRPATEASLLIIRNDSFQARLKAMIDMRPKGIIICQQSWRPDVELVPLPEAELEQLQTPIVMVTYEAGEELKTVAASGANPWVTMEIQPYGGVCAWGNGTFGQLGLSGIENQNFMTVTQNVLTNEENVFANRPYYVAHLHEHQVTSIACGAAHTVAVTQQGEVFTWGAADGLGVPLSKQASEVPLFVEQLEGLVKSTKAFAGHYHSFVVADMPYRAVV